MVRLMKELLSVRSVEAMKYGTTTQKTLNYSYAKSVDKSFTRRTKLMSDEEEQEEKVQTLTIQFIVLCPKTRHDVNVDEDCEGVCESYRTHTNYELECAFPEEEEE